MSLRQSEKRWVELSAPRVARMNRYQFDKGKYLELSKHPAARLVWSGLRFAKQLKQRAKR